MEKGYSNISFLELAEAKSTEGKNISKRRPGRAKKPNMKQFTIRMEASVHKNLKDVSATTGENTSAIIQRVVIDFLKKSNLFRFNLLIKAT